MAESWGGRSQGNVTPTDQPVEKPADMNNDTKMEFSSSVRAKVAKEHKDTVVGLEVWWGWGGWVVNYFHCTGL